MKKLIHEVHRRSLWQILGIYAAGGWIVLQVVDQLVESAGLPGWVPSLALVLLLIGLPMVVATAFVQEGLPGHGGGTADGTPTVPEQVDAMAPESVARRADRAPSSGGPPTREEASSWLRGSVFTWRNAIAGGIAALALFGAVTAVWLVLRGAGVGSAGTLVAKGLIDRGDRVILADFSGDSSLATVATMALRVDLGQSDVVSVAEPSYVQGVLQRMQADTVPGEHLTDAMAREVAIREGLKAVISGDVATAAGSHVLSVRVTAAESGQNLVTLRETASDSSKVMESIDRLSRQLRERLGEALGSIRASASLAKATTPSLEALRRYSSALAAIDAGDNEKGIALLDEAIAFDSAFGMAWRKLAAVDPERRELAATRAYELHDAMTDRERYHTVGLYHYYVTRDLDAAAAAYESLLEYYPDDAWALNNLGLVYSDQGELDLSTETLARAIDADAYSVGSSAFTNLIGRLHDQGRVDSARAVLQHLNEVRPGHPAYHRYDAAFAMAEGDYDAAEQKLQPLLEGSMLGQRRWARGQHSAIEAVRGRLSRAERLWRDAAESRDSLELVRWWLGVALDAGLDTARALARLDRAVAAAPDSQVVDWGIGLGFTYALRGRLQEARELYRRGVEGDSASEANMESWQRDQRAAFWEAAQAHGAGEYDRSNRKVRDAMILLLEHVPEADTANLADLLAVNDLLAGDTTAAIAHWELWLGRRQLFRAWSDRSLAPTLERLAELYDARDDLEHAAGYYARFVEVWKDADPELQPRVRKARARLEEIARERG